MPRLNGVRVLLKPKHRRRERGTPRLWRATVPVFYATLSSKGCLKSLHWELSLTTWNPPLNDLNLLIAPSLAIQARRCCQEKVAIVTREVGLAERSRGSWGRRASRAWMPPRKPSLPIGRPLVAACSTRKSLGHMRPANPHRFCATATGDVYESCIRPIPK